MIRYFHLCFLLILSGFGFAQNMEKIALDEGRFEFELPDYCIPLPESFMEAMKPLNEFVVYGANCNDENTNALLSVSIYDGEAPASIEDAFEETVNTVGGSNLNMNPSAYRLIDFKTYDKDGRTLRYKISLSDGEVYSIMFYFMKNDHGKDLFELKGVTRHDSLADAFKLLEKAALSAEFK